MIKRWHLFLLSFVLLASLAAGYLYVNQLDDPPKRGVIMLSLGMDHTSLPTETSSYDIQRASQHFSEVVLGWTLEPSFEAEVKERFGSSYGVSSRQQENQNIILNVTADPADYDENDLWQVTSILRERIDRYNELTNGDFLIALDTYSTQDSFRSNWRILIGFPIVFLSLAVFLLFVWEYGFKMRRS